MLHMNYMKKKTLIVLKKQLIKCFLLNYLSIIASSLLNLPKIEAVEKIVGASVAVNFLSGGFFQHRILPEGLVETEETN